MSSRVGSYSNRTPLNEMSAIDASVLRRCDPAFHGVLALGQKFVLKRFEEVGPAEHEVRAATIAAKLAPLGLQLLHDHEVSGKPD